MIRPRQMGEFEIKRRGTIRAQKQSENVLRSRFFLMKLKRIKDNECLYVMEPDAHERKRLFSRFRTRLWRYAEAKQIGYREYSVRAVLNGIKVVRNLDPLETFEKRNLKRRGARAV